MITADNSKDNITEKAKRYSSIKYGLVIVETVYLLLLLFLFQLLGFSNILAKDIHQLMINDYFAVLFYILIVYITCYILNFPLNFYHSFLLEHEFQLSRQNIKEWFTDQIKGGVIAYGLSIIGLEVFYFILRHQPQNWWWILSIFWIFFSLILARLTPVIIVPLFFKYKKLSDESLRQRIISLALKMKIKILDVFEIDLSKKTAKVNAGLVGWGATKRVILADALREKYSSDEIEVILAHEFAHYKLQHLIKLILINVLVTILCFYFIAKTSVWFLRFFSLSSLSDIASLPLVFLYLILFAVFMQPLENIFSRGFEKNADTMALKSTGLKDAFISTMDKLASQNLSDRNPHPVIKFLFFDHPPIDERISYANTVFH